MTTTQTRNIDWTTAEIEHGTLAVELTGRASKEWKERFDRVLALLRRSHGRWGEVGLTKKGIRVDNVGEGSESELGHFLESVTLEVNAELEPDGDRSEARDSESDPQKRIDRRMAATFRGFAERRDS